MTTSSRQPNIVLINCDDLGYGDLGCYGSDRHRTPAIDALAADGVRFTDFYMGSPVCTPSRAAMLTGCYPNRIGFTSLGGNGVLFPGHRFGLAQTETTIAAVLRDAGYATMLTGKWHCGDQPPFLPTAHGFDHYFGLPYSNDMGVQVWPDHLPPPAELFKRYGVDIPLDRPPLPLMVDDEVIQAQPDQAALTERYVEASIRFLRENRHRPFFLYFAHLYVHLPIYVQDRFRRESSNDRYGAAVACIDWSTAMLRHELDRLGIADNTLIVFTSDNGALARGPDAKGGTGSNLPLRAAKGTTWEGGQRVPCIATWPDRIAAGRTCREIASAIDLLPTFASAAGASAPRDRTIDGHDLLGLLTADEPSPRDEFVFLSRGSVEAIRVGRWKLHLRKGAKEVCELYDLETDIGETDDRSGHEQSVVAALTRRIEECRRELGDEALGIAGSDVRPIGEVDQPVTLTVHDDHYPYYLAEYDLVDRG